MSARPDDFFVRFAVEDVEAQGRKCRFAGYDWRALVHLPVEIGEILASKYRVEGVLGEGAMGVVVAARHVQLGSLFALKFMRADVVRVEGAAERFNREARAAARLRGEHVARVTDFGTLDNGSPYIVMEFLDGADL